MSYMKLHSKSSWQSWDLWLHFYQEEKTRATHQNKSSEAHLVIKNMLTKEENTD